MLSPRKSVWALALCLGQGQAGMVGDSLPLIGALFMMSVKKPLEPLLAKPHGASFSPSADDQLVNLSWSGNITVTLCATHPMTIWELSTQDSIQIEDTGTGCVQIQYIEEHGQRQLYVQGIEALDYEYSTVQTEKVTGTVALSRIAPDYTPETTQSREGLFLQLGLSPRLVVPDNVHASEDLIAIRYSRNADPSTLIQQCPWWSCCCKPKTGGSRMGVYMVNTHYESAGDIPTPPPPPSGNGREPPGGGDDRELPDGQKIIVDEIEVSLKDLLKRLTDVINDDFLLDQLILHIKAESSLTFSGCDVDRAFWVVDSEPGEWLKAFMVMRLNPDKLGEFVSTLSRNNRTNLARILNHLNHFSPRRNTVHQQGSLSPTEDHFYEEIPECCEENENEYVFMQIQQISQREQLQQAIQNQDLNKIRALLSRGLNVLGADEGQEIIGQAIATGNPEILIVLSDSGVNFQVAGQLGKSASRIVNAKKQQQRRIRRPDNPDDGFHEE